MAAKTEVKLGFWVDGELVERINGFKNDLGLTHHTIAILLEAAMNAIDDGNWHYESGKLYFKNQ